MTDEPEQYVTVDSLRIGYSRYQVIDITSLCDLGQSYIPVGSHAFTLSKNYPINLYRGEDHEHEYLTKVFVFIVESKT